jgi:hypothetical protein
LDERLHGLAMAQRMVGLSRMALSCEIAIDLIEFGLDDPCGIMCLITAQHVYLPRTARSGGVNVMDMVRVEIDSIRVSLMSQDRVIILKDTTSQRYLPIWIGAPEAEAIRVELQGVQLTRPLTHDLLRSVIRELGGEVEHIFVSKLLNDVFYAQIKIKANGRTLDIDSRPSDAIALAVRLQVPIYVAEAVMQQASIEPEDEIDAEVEIEQGSTSVPSRDEAGGGEEEDLSAFSDFLNSLDLDNLGDDE